MDTPPALRYDPRVPWNALPELPPRTDLETPAILKTCIEARVALARVNALAESMPNRSILIHALPLQEARSSSEIENIVTTGDELYRALASGASADAAAKEVLRYREALWEGMEGLDRRPNLDVRLFERICSRIRGVDVRVRQGRVAIGNPAHGRVILHASRWRRARQAARQSGTFSRRAGGRSRSAHQDGRHALPVRGHSPVH